MLQRVAASTDVAKIWSRGRSCYDSADQPPTSKTALEASNAARLKRSAKSLGIQLHSGQHSDRCLCQREV